MEIYWTMEGGERACKTKGIQTMDEWSLIRHLDCRL